MKRRRYSTADYTEAMELLKHMGTRKASKLLGIPRSTLINWKHGQKPWQAKWTPKPTKELAYIIGVLMGDGTAVKHGSHYELRLVVRDREFAEEFNKMVAKLLNRKENKIKYLCNRKMWAVKFGSIAFYEWFKNNDFNDFKYYIERTFECVKYFLRGLYDSEGSHIIVRSGNRSIINLYNSNLELLHYVKYLLIKYFGIKANGPYLNRKAGSYSAKKDGSVIISKKDRYVLSIRRLEDVNVFLIKVGFSITRKQDPLR